MIRSEFCNPKPQNSDLKTPNLNLHGLLFCRQQVIPLLRMIRYMSNKTQDQCFLVLHKPIVLCGQQAIPL